MATGKSRCYGEICCINDAHFLHVYIDLSSLSVVQWFLALFPLPSNFWRFDSNPLWGRIICNVVNVKCIRFLHFNCPHGSFQGFFSRLLGIPIHRFISQFLNICHFKVLWILGLYLQGFSLLSIGGRSHCLGFLASSIMSCSSCHHHPHSTWWSKSGCKLCERCSTNRSAARFDLRWCIPFGGWRWLRSFLHSCFLNGNHK